MKKLLCILLSLVFLLSFAACGEEEKEEGASDEAQIKELIINKHKEMLYVATKEEIKSIRSEAYWAKHSFDEYYDRYNGTALSTGDELVKEKVGDNYSFSVEIKELTFHDDKEMLAKYEESFEKVYGYELDGIEKYCDVTCVVRLQGDKDVFEWEYAGTDMPAMMQVFKIDGKWCFY